MLIQLKKEEKEKQAMDQQMEFARKFQEARQLESNNMKAEPVAPLNLDEKRQEVSFSFSSKCLQKFKLIPKIL